MFSITQPIDPAIKSNLPDQLHAFVRAWTWAKETTRQVETKGFASLDTDLVLKRIR